MKNLITVSILILLFLGTAFPQGPVGYWRMEESAGPTLYDSSGNNLNATATNSPTFFQTGTKGRCVSFNGSSQYATVPDNNLLDITGNITLAAWMNCTKTGFATMRIMTKALMNNTSGYELSLSSAGRVFFRVNQAPSTDYNRINSAQSYPINGTAWMHVAATYDGATMRIYINGVLDSSKARTFTIVANTVDLSIGRDGGNQYYFGGRIDEARVYNRALSDPEILALAQTKTWSGATNTRWDTTSNWNPRGVPTNLNDLTILNVANLPTLTAGGACRDLLVMNGAKITTSANTLTVDGTINYDGDGRVLGILTRNNLSGTGTKYLMSANNYIDITTAGITSITIQEFAGTPPPSTPPEYDATRGVNRYYTISALGGGGGAGKVGLDYLLTEKGTNLLPTDGCVWEYSGSGPWLNLLGGGAGSGADWCWGSSLTPIDQSNLAGNFTIAAGDAALPVQLASFIGNFVGNSVNLEWQTISEINNFGFNVQRYNSNVKTYENVGFVAGKGLPSTYTFLDENVIGSVEYRLEQIDNDGLVSYFGPIMLNPNSVGDNPLANGPAVFALNQNYPNPFNPTTNISFSLKISGYTTLKVYNILGNEVATLFNGNAEAGKRYEVNFNAQNLGSGMYFYKLQSGSNVEVKKMILMK